MKLRWLWWKIKGWFNIFDFCKHCADGDMMEKFTTGLKTLDKNGGRITIPDVKHERCDYCGQTYVDADDAVNKEDWGYFIRGWK